MINATEDERGPFMLRMRCRIEYNEFTCTLSLSGASASEVLEIFRAAWSSVNAKLNDMTKVKPFSAPNSHLAM